MTLNFGITFFDMCNNDLFLEFQGISELAKKLANTGKHETYPLVYLLVKLVLTIPVTTTTVERSFSTMKNIKNDCAIYEFSAMLDCVY